MWLGIFFAELTVLFLLSRTLTQRIYEFFLLSFGSRSVATSIVTLLQFPGTVIHELSHLFTAEVLGVRTGRFTLVPESIRGEPVEKAIRRGEEIRAGSVAVAHTDPFRRATIGLAPLFSGLLVLIAIAYWLPGLLEDIRGSSTNWLSNPSAYYLLLTTYLLFAVSNSMFSSKEDLKGCLPLAISLGIIGAAIYIAGFRMQLTGAILEVATRVLTTLVRSLGLVLAVNAGLLVLALIGSATLTNITGRKIARR